VEAVGNAARGDELAWVALEIEDGVVVAGRGEGPGIAELLAQVRGRDILAAAAVPGAPLATDALHDALAAVAYARRSVDRVAVAMSGGVDSAVALLRAREQGREPVGVTLRLWTDPAGRDAERACCSPEQVLAARAVCHAVGVPHFTLDLREDFRRTVVAPFVAGYARGETPNPCVRCNGSFRFGELLAFARRIGATRLATGHYAQIREHRGRLLLARAVDRDKDQSYMLGRLDPRLLSRLWFPLGGQTKAETRFAARAAGLAAADRAESQEACFLAGDDVRTFLERHGLPREPGDVVAEDGTLLGRHDGFWRFTAGQRRGLGVATGAPVYALRTERQTNTVVVGPRASLARTAVSVRPGSLYVSVDRAEVKLRYRSPAVEAAVEPSARGFRLALDEPAYGVADGQAAVLYEDDAVVGAGLISSARDR
jgi:tRNA-uridine 2-sulfurtransferase